MSLAQNDFSNATIYIYMLKKLYIICCFLIFYRSLRVRRDMSPAGIVRIVGDILCEHVRNNVIKLYIHDFILIFLFILVSKNDTICALL